MIFINQFSIEKAAVSDYKDYLKVDPNTVDAFPLSVEVSLTNTKQYDIGFHELCNHFYMDFVFGMASSTKSHRLNCSLSSVS